MADGEWLSIICPDIKGGNNPLYWGEQAFSGGAFYFGAILVALFFMFLVAGRDPPMAAHCHFGIGHPVEQEGRRCTDGFLS